MRRYFDLHPYEGCPEDGDIGLLPLAIGWLSRKWRYEQGNLPPEFIAQLLVYCRRPNLVCHTPKARPCPICRKRIEIDGVVYGSAEIRVIGEIDIFAAPDLIYHFVTAHQYKPPQEFIEAVTFGVGAGSAEHRALINALL